MRSDAGAQPDCQSPLQCVGLVDSVTRHRRSRRCAEGTGLCRSLGRLSHDSWPTNVRRGHSAQPPARLCANNGLMGTNKLMADLCRCGMARDRDDADVVAMRMHTAMYVHAVSKHFTVRRPEQYACIERRWHKTRCSWARVDMQARRRAGVNTSPALMGFSCIEPRAGLCRPKLLFRAAKYTSPNIFRSRIAVRRSRAVRRTARTSSQLNSVKASRWCVRQA